MAPRELGKMSAIDVSARAASSMQSGLCSICMRFTSTGTKASTDRVMRDSSDEMTSSSHSSFSAMICRVSSPSARSPPRISFRRPRVWPAAGIISSSPPPRRRRSA